MKAGRYYILLFLLLTGTFTFAGFMIERNHNHKVGNTLCDHFFQELYQMAEHRNFEKFDRYVSHSFIQSLEGEIVEANMQLENSMQPEVDSFYRHSFDYKRFIVLIKLMEKFGEPVVSDYYLTETSLVVTSSYHFPDTYSLIPLKFMFLREGNSLQLQAIDGLVEVFHGYHQSPLSRIKPADNNLANS